jgi:hypothetical protein
MKSNRGNINQFCFYFQDSINEIVKLNNQLYQKILIISLMDTLSRVWTKGKENKNKLRYLKLIRECIKWEHDDRISIPMTVYRIREENIKGNDKLMTEIDRLFNKFQNGGIPRIDIDPFFNEIEHLAVSIEEQEILKNSRHAELLYTYRNNLIHEFRNPGHGMEFSNDNESPYYHRMTHRDCQTKTWELVYPTNFFIILSNIALTAIKTFLISNNLDPFSFFKFGSPW